MKISPPLSALCRAIARTALLLVPGLVLQCASSPQRPDLVLIVIDTMRADHLGCYGYERGISPAIDRLADESVRFERAYSTAPWTLPAFASILTGLYPRDHGASLDFFAVKESTPLLAEELRDAGYQTAAFVSHIYTSSRYGFDRGYETFEEFGLADDYAFDQEREPNAERVITAAVEWLRRRDGSRPLFLTVHLFDPHWDYAAPAPFAGSIAGPSDSFAVDGTFASIRPYMESHEKLRAPDVSHLKDLYDEEIQYTDAWIDTLLTFLDARDRAPVVALTADHGEEFQEHDGLGHAYTFYDEVLRVPLLLRVPGHARSEPVRSDWVTTADIFSTLIDLAGVDAHGPIGGSLLHAGARRELFASTNRDGRYGSAVLAESRKLVWDREGITSLDPLRDPAESRAPIDDALSSLFASLAATATEGWTIRMPADTETLICSVTVDGFILDVVPLTRSTPPVSATENTRFRIETRPGEAGALRFRVAPPNAAVTFSFSSDGRSIPASRIRIGAGEIIPPSGRFTLDPGRAPEGAFHPVDSPADPHGAGPVITLDLLPITNAPETIELSPAERDRLRALGYF